MLLVIADYSEFFQNRRAHCHAELFDCSILHGASGSSKYLRTHRHGSLYGHRPYRAEYVKGDRKTFAGEKHDDDRVGLMAKYNF